jgi:hypothetical protein
VKEKRLVKGAQLAREIGVTRQTIVEWRKKGIIVGYKQNSAVVLYDVEEVVAALKSRRGAPTQPAATS